MTTSNPNIAVKESSKEISNEENSEKDQSKGITYNVFKSLPKLPDEQDKHKKKEIMINIEKTNALDIEEDSVVDANKKMLIPFDNTVGSFSLQISKQDKASGPGFIFSKDYKTIYNLDEKCPPVPYCEGFDAKFSPDKKIFVYPTRYFINSHNDNDTGQRVPVLIGPEITRPDFLTDVLIILTMQLVFTFSMTFACVFIDCLRNCVKESHTMYFLAFTGSMALFFVIICYHRLRSLNPWNYLTLIIFTLCTAYQSSYLFCLYGSKMLLICFIGTLIIITAIGLLSIINCIDFTTCFALINTLFLSSMIFYIIAALYANFTGNIFLIYIFHWTLTVVIILSLIHQFQLMLGKGNYAIHTDEYILSALLLYIEIIIIFMVLPYLIASPPRRM